MSVKTGMSLFALTWEAQMVIALRMTQFAFCAPGAALEAGRMVTEKIAAGAEAAGLMSAAMLRGAPDAGAHQVVSMLHRKVRANRRRLAR